MLEIDNLKIILKRFKRSDFPYVLKNWDYLSTRGLNIDVEKVRSAVFVDAVAKKLKHDVTPTLVADLDLFSQQKYSNRNLWKVMKIEKISETNPYNISNIAKLEKKLRKHIRCYLDAQVHCREYHHAYWMRIAIKNGPRSVRRGAMTTSNIYIVHIPRTEYIVVTGLKLKHTDYVMQAFLTVLHGHSVSNCHLSGYHLVSLLQLVLSKHLQGTDVLPTGEQREETEETLPDNVYNENHREKHRRDQYVLDNFGPYKQHKLKKITYKMETKFKGLKYVPMMARHNKPFHCQVKFEGANVLEGLRNLAVAGLAEYPMKPHVGRVHVLAKNVFLLKENVKR